MSGLRKYNQLKKYPLLRNVALKMLIMFETIYVCDFTLIANMDYGAYQIKDEKDLQMKYYIII